MSQLTSRGLDNTSSAFVSDLGAGKHPSPLDISESYSPDLYLKVGLYLIKKYYSCPKLSQFKDRALLWLVPAPIYTCCDVSDDIWVLASTLDPSASEINKALSVTYKLLFILSKNIVPSRSYRYIRDRAFPVTRLPPPIYTKFDVKQRYIYTFGCWQAPEPSWHIRILFSWSLSKSRFLPHQKILFLSKVIAV